jgi:hypothetical protein
MSGFLFRRTMAQIARPSSDIATNSWTPSTGATLFGCIDEVTPADGDYIQRNAVAYCEVGLSSVIDPGVATGHIVRYRYGRSRTDRTLTLVVRLMQGASEIASWTHTNPSLSYVLAEQTLTPTEANAITDYSSLSLRFDITAIQNGQVYGQVSWAEFEVPNAGVQPVTINCGAPATLASSGQSTTITKGAVTVHSGSSATLASTGQTVDILAPFPPVTVNSGAPATLASSGQVATVQSIAGGSQVDCQVGTLVSSGQSAHIIGEEYLTLDIYQLISISDNVVIEEKLYDPV